MNNAIIEAVPGRYFSTVWFVPGKDKDFMGAMWRDGDGPYHFTFRFRYYDGKMNDGPFNDDMKHTYHTVDEASRSEAEAKESLLRVLQKLIGPEWGFYPDELDEVVIQSADPMEVIAKITARPWAHVQTNCKGGDA